MSMQFKGELDSKGRARPVVVCGPSRTKQSFKDQVNINRILARYRKSGMVDHLNRMTPFYGDVSGLVDYQEALHVVKRAEELFGGMSSDVRNRFDNDPMAMVRFLQDPKNLDEAVKLGMVVKRPDKAVEPKTPPSGGSDPK